MARTILFNLFRVSSIFAALSSAMQDDGNKIVTALVIAIACIVWFTTGFVEGMSK